jgi:hypothetical protein
LLPNQPTTQFVKLRIWNVFRAGVSMYHTSDVAFRYLSIYGDWSAQDRNDTGSYGMHLATYENRNLVIRYSHIEGMRIGIAAPRKDGSLAGREQPTRIQATSLENYINVFVQPAWDFGPGNGTSLVLENVKFDLLTDVPAGPADPATIDPPANIQMKLAETETNVVQPSVVKVYGYNQVRGDDFQVFYREQAANFVVPQSDSAVLSGRAFGTIGSPQSGWTNLQNWNQYKIAVAGEVAPSTTTRAGINGFVGPLANSAAITPRVVFVTPWNGAEIDGSPPVRIRYNVNGLLPANSWVWFSLDGGVPFTDFKDGGLFGIAPGSHTLTAWIGNIFGTERPGTIGASVTFHVADGFGTPSGGSGTASPAAATADHDAALDTAGYESIAVALAAYGGRDSAVPVENARSMAGMPPAMAPAPLATEIADRAAPIAQHGGALAHKPASGNADDALGDELLCELAADVASTDLSS